ncbi:unnamed protein product [Caenorhabditis angaria]|uniref:Uncharacterized protein n=1 Tax=Caenorhabditis angaria TaxID=860376 RepID=A0A9P1IL30_9PELO|nr:unnamed protein product [Caenorhabditis angaria]
MEHFIKGIANVIQVESTVSIMDETTRYIGRFTSSPVTWTQHLLGFQYSELMAVISPPVPTWMNFGSLAFTKNINHRLRSIWSIFFRYCQLGKTANEDLD